MRLKTFSVRCLLLPKTSRRSEWLTPGTRNVPTGLVPSSKEIVSRTLKVKVKRGSTPSGKVDILLKVKVKRGVAYPLLRVQSEQVKKERAGSLPPSHLSLILRSV